MGQSESPAYWVLRPSTRRLLRFIETEVARAGTDRVMLANATLEMIGSRRVYLPGLHELAVLGWIDVERYPKHHAISLSTRWQQITSEPQASATSAAARRLGKSPLLHQAHLRARA